MNRINAFTRSDLQMTWCGLPKSDLTEKLPFAETRGFAGFGAAICRVRCGVIYSASGTGKAARTGSRELRSHSIRICERLAHMPAALEADLSSGVRLEANALSGSGYGNIALDLEKYQ